MMIDASYQPGGRQGCCGGASGIRPFPPPMPPVFPTEPDVLQLNLAAAQTGIANGAAIPLTGTVRQTGNGLRYDAATHAVTVSEAGVYTFIWNVLVQTETGDAPVLRLQSLDGQVVLGISGLPAETAAQGAMLSGSAVAYLPAGTAWVLVNATGAPLNIPAAGTAPAVFAASVTVAENAAMNRFPQRS